VTTRAGRFGPLLALLLVLLGMSAAVAPRSGDGHAARTSQYRVVGDSVSTSPSVRDDLRDWLRISGVARPVLATAAPDTGWAVCPRAADGGAPPGWSLVGEVGGAGVATAVTTSRSSRAPPVHVN
jgi:hypothetical protein